MDIAILQWFESIRNPLLNVFFSVYTALGNHGEMWLVIIIVTALNKKTRPIALVALLALASEFIIVDGILKPIFVRLRPFQVHDFELLIKAPSGYSFPSGHAASSFSVAMVFVLFKYRHRWFLLTLALLMAISRLYHCVHYPSDVFAGAFIGSLIALTTWHLFNHIQHRKS